MAKQIKFGSEGKDIVTGLTGIIVARVEYISGCVHLGIAPPAKDGKVPDTVYIDEDRVEIIGEGVVMKITNDGGPQRDAPR